MREERAVRGDPFAVDDGAEQGTQVFDPDFILAPQQARVPAPDPPGAQDQAAGGVAADRQRQGMPLAPAAAILEAQVEFDAVHHASPTAR
ncbi:hypothetical protein HNR28_002327 [Castellaniella defragrans]|uniref:Uncharacterized protein n=1 Tax=Castellaniella defragrans TaxID=75697 RepID=A0A7W9TR91_CASDE|nr:hypothetical protein [Castellaniella defragrans]MBB6084282.1 hypothetical protein [Castellaniella defragrans]